MTLFQPNERRKNRGEASNEVIEKCERQVLIMREALLTFSNTTKRKMPDWEFRNFVQDKAHDALTKAERFK